MIHYFDNCATTRVDDTVLETINKYQTEKYFNPSARSTYSLDVANDIAVSRAKIASILGVDSSEVYFTSGGTEADNIAILGALRSKRSGNVVVTATEHSAVYNTILELSGRGLEIRIANSLPDGHIDIDDFISKVDPDTVFACFMHVNNETGAINDVKKINSLVKSKNPKVITFCDGVQAVGKIVVNVASLGVNLYSFSGHKIHCSKGTGCLIVRKGTKISSIIFGGGQEKGLRSGTEYVAGIVALSKALEISVRLINENSQNFLQYKSIIRNKLDGRVDYKELCIDNASPSIITFAFADIKGEVLIHMLEKYKIIAGTGSACSSKNKQSRTAKAIGLDARYTEGVLRISFSKYNAKAEVEFLAEKLRDCVLELRKTMLG